jgi:hypothetical protein
MVIIVVLPVLLGVVVLVLSLAKVVRWNRVVGDHVTAIDPAIDGWTTHV